MLNFPKLLCLLALSASLSVAHAQVLNANPIANNGSGGVFMTFTAAANPVTLTSIDTFVDTGIGTANYEIWTRPGTYAGFTASNAGWTLVGTATSGDTFLNTLVNIDIPDITISATSTVSVLLHGTTRGVRYNGTGASPPTTTFSNADLTLFTDVARVGLVSFGGTQITPRALAGNVNYTVVPEPVSMITLGLAALALARRRARATS